MVTARRERAKKEQTFLDVVKQFLEGLREDISSIKTSVTELKTAGWLDPEAVFGWDDWTT